MLILKKLLFAPFFLTTFIILIYQLNPLFKSYDFIFSLSINTLVQLVVISSLICLTSFLFVLFASISMDWKFLLPISALASLTPVLFLDPPLAVVFSIGVLIALIITFLSLEHGLKSYLTFEVGNLLGPSIRHLLTLLILSICVVYFLSASKMIAQNGFQVPDSLIDTALKFSPQPQSQETTQQLSIPSATSSQVNDLIKQTIKDQVQSFLKPYLGIIPAVLAVLLFLTLQSLTSIINILVYPLLWIIFTILEKTGFVKFTEEMRPVKKMVT